MRILPDRPRKPARRARRPRLEALEDRTVLSAVFDSVLAVGNDTVSILPKANAVDAAGNTYVTGILYGSMDLDPGVDRPDGSDILTPPGSASAYIAKYAPDNTLIWARQVGSDYLRLVNANDPFEQGRDIAVDDSGNVYVTGDYVGQVTLGSTTLPGSGSTNVFVTKLDPDGNFLWAQSWGGASTREFGNSIAVDGAGNVVSAGFSANLTSNGAWWANGFEIHRYSASGTPSWSVRYANPGGIADSVATDTAGNIYVSGSFNGTLDFNPHPRKTYYVSGAGGYSGGQAYNGFVLKLTSSGAFGWVSPFIARTGEQAGSAIYAQTLALDAGGNVIVGGSYRGQVDIDPNSKKDRRLPNISASGNDGYVAKLSPAGALLWAPPLGGGTVWDLAVDSSGGVYAAGDFHNEFVPGGGLPSVTSQGSSDVFLAKLTASGSVDWVSTFGGTSSELCYAVAVGDDGMISLAGAFRATVDFDPDPLVAHELTNSYYSDMFILKIRQQ
jgi:hypothetical protein